jgi:hypothetical protein
VGVRILGIEGERERRGGDVSGRVKGECVRVRERWDLFLSPLGEGGGRGRSVGENQLAFHLRH